VTPAPRASRLFRLLLRLYPAWFREAHGPEMEELFLARRSRIGSPRGWIRLWTRTAGDTLETWRALRRRPIDPSARRPSGGLMSLWHDVRYGIRQLARTPVFTTGAFALLAVGIGANVAVFAVIDRLLIRPLPYDRPDEVVYLYQDSDGGEPSETAFPAYRDMAASDVFSVVAATSPDTLTWESGESAAPAAIEFTTSSYLAVIGLPMEWGRWFGPEHDRLGGEPAAVISAAAWRTKFGGDRDIVGRTIRLGGQPVTIIGVGPRALSGSYAPAITDFWLSISSTPIAGAYRAANLELREDHWYDVRARLKPGVGTVQAQAAMDALAARLGERYPHVDRGRGITVRAATAVREYADTRAPLMLALALTTTLLLLAGANLANLLLVRGIARLGEVAVRRALGAGTIRMARLHFVEALLLCGAGGLAGVGLAHLALAGLPLAPLPAPFSANLDLSIDGRIAAFAVTLMIVTGVLFALAPALRSIRSDVAGALRGDRRTSSVGRGTVRLRNALVVIQVAGSLVVVLVAGLLGRSLVALQRLDPGVDVERVAWARFDLSPAGLEEDALATALEHIRARIKALPGVTGAAIASRLPAQRSGTTSTIIEGYTPEAGTDATELSALIVTPEYFETMGLRLIAGRTFAATDVRGADRVVVVNETAARRYWGGHAAVGGRMRSQARNAPFRTVVGIVEDSPVAEFPERPVRPMFYVAAAQATVTAGYVLARTDRASDTLPAEMRSAAIGARAGVDVSAQGTLASIFDAALARPRFIAGTVSVASILAVVLAGLGLYSVVAFNAARRAGELGIRMALGASASRVARLVVRDAVGSVALGLAAGLVAAAALVPRLEPALFGVAPRDPVTFAGGLAAFAMVAGFAAYVPARRAARTDPSVTLRAS
jgi:predicted permease